VTTLQLDLDDIQGNILRGYGAHATSYIFLSIHDAAEAKAWLADLVPQITTANVPPPDVALNIAVTHAGLRALGVPADAMGTFPAAFTEGMAKRSSVIGDTGANAPRRWEAPFRAHDALHLMAIVAGRDAGKVHQRVEELQQELWQAGLYETAPPLAAHRLPGDREHFGYQDGMSQPGVLGLHEEGGEGEGAYDDGAWRPLQPGEFILGMPDEDGVPSMLSEPPELTRNGTYLVLRRLGQDVQEFRRLINSAAEQAGMTPELAAAKIMGRWPDGTPLTLRDSPDSALASDKQRNNRFTYVDDAEGHRCPLGAHIRRANPRASLGFGGALERRHRIIRRGMPYGPPPPPDGTDDEVERGLAFVCYQADIARQFEFIQSEWLNDGNVFALSNDRDPLIGDPGGGSRRMRIEGHPPVFVDALQHTVTVRGGAYFLVPGVRGLRSMSQLPDPRSEPDT
jgi:Dyp-type peroxidase family